MEPNHRNPFSIFEIFRYTVYLAFYLLSVRMVYVSLFIAPVEITIVLGIVGLFVTIMTWWNLLYSLYSFIAVIPLVSGLKQVGLLPPTQIFSYWFAVIYITWLTQKILVRKEKITYDKMTSNMIDILSGIVLLSLIFLYLEFPLDTVLYRLGSVPFLDARHALYGLEAGYIILQGLFLFRIMEQEVFKKADIHKIKWLFVTQALMIILFSCVQYFFNKPQLGFGGNGLYSPFEDLHSYGSYIVFLFFVFWGISEDKNNRNKRLLIPLLTILAILIILSYSRATWAAFLFIGAIVLFYRVNKTLFFGGTSVILGLIILANLNQSKLLQSDNSYHRRLGHLIVVGNFDKDRSVVSRVNLWKRAVAMMRDYPMTGRGIGTYFNRSPQYDVAASQRKVSGANKNTHNYYLQMGSELGLPALLIFLYLIFCTFRKGITVVLQKKENHRMVKGMLLGLGAYLLTMLTGHPLLLSNQQFLFWFIIAVITILSREYVNHPLPVFFSRHSNMLVGALVLVLSVGYVDKIYGTHRDRAEIKYGFYDVEKWAGEDMRWAMRYSSQHLKPKGNLFGLTIFAPRENIGAKGLKVKLSLNNKTLDQLHFYKSGFKSRYYHIPSLGEEKYQLSIEVDKSSNAYKFSPGRDRRDLAVAMTPLTYLKIMPKSGVGFYHWEKWDNKAITEWPEDKPFSVRWTRMQASINAPNELAYGGKVYLKCAHPDIQKNPVKVKIYIDEQLFTAPEFNDYQWKKIVLPKERIRNVDVVTLKVSRTWNPRRNAKSNDGRDLGVAVAVLAYDSPISVKLKTIK